MASKLSTYRPLFFHKNFMKTIIGYNISRFGDSIDAIVFSWLLYEVTGSASMIALIMAVNFLPTILLQPFAAVISERLDKVRTIAFCNTVRFVVVGVTALLYQFGMLSSAVLFGFVLINSTVEAFENPASAALSPKLLPRELYTSGAAFRGTIGRVVELVGMACAGGIIGLFGSATALLIDAFSFLICAGIILTIRIKEEKAETKLDFSVFFSDLKEGFLYAAKSPVMRMLLLFGAFLNLSAVPYSTFQTVFVADTLKMGPGMLSVAGVVMTVLMGVGSFVTPVLLKRIKRRTVMTISCLAIGVSYVPMAAAGMPESAWGRAALWLIGIAVLSLAIGVVTVLFNSLFMETVDEGHMARVSGLANAALTSMTPVGSLVCAAVAAFCPVAVTFLVAAVLMVLIFLPISRMKGFRMI